MQQSLAQGERLRLYVGDGGRKHVRIKHWVDDTCFCVSCADLPALVSGDMVEAERLGSGPRALYYLQALGHPDADMTRVLLRRNPMADFNKRRHGWRVPYTGAAAIRARGATHFLSAQFKNLSMRAACVLSEAQLPSGEAVELRLKLPEFPEHIVSGVVLRASRQALRQDVYGREIYGLVILFNYLEGRALRHLTLFMWQRVRATYPAEIQLIFNSTHRSRTPFLP